MSSHTYSLKKIGVPSVTPFFEKLQEGCKVTIHGKVNTHTEEFFDIEFLAGHNVPLHMNFYTSKEGSFLTINSLNEDHWGEEKRVKSPLHNGDEFRLLIHVTAKHYNIELMGKPVAEFKHRLPFEKVQALGIKGGLELKSIQYAGFPFTSKYDEDTAFDYGHKEFDGYGTKVRTEGLKTVMKMAELSMAINPKLLEEKAKAQEAKAHGS